jgi:YebC/PmpR family DNA-binding regulatory protein
MSGHSKWANIKHRKGKQDAKRGKVFTRIGKEITIAARLGGGEIESNPRLRLAVQNGRAVNMPFENISRAIKKGTGEIEGVNYEETLYEGYAPCGVAIMVECVTDNKNRTVAEIRSQMGKFGGNMGESNSVAWNFERKGVFSVKNMNKTEEDLMEHVIMAEAEDLDFGDESSRVICPMENFAICNKYLTDNSFEIEEGKLEYLPKNVVEIKDVNDAKKILSFIERLEDQEDVQNIYANFDISDEIMDQIED